VIVKITSDTASKVNTPTPSRFRMSRTVVPFMIDLSSVMRPVRHSNQLRHWLNRQKRRIFMSNQAKILAIALAIARI
jgi:hypothetical protein